VWERGVRRDSQSDKNRDLTGTETSKIENSGTMDKQIGLSTVHGLEAGRSGVLGGKARRGINRRWKNWGSETKTTQLSTPQSKTLQASQIVINWIARDRENRH